MNYRVLLQPADKCFNATPDQTILDAAKNNGVALRRGCLVGACRLCRTKLIKGTIEYQHGASVYLTEEEIKQNYFLPCCAIATSDIECQQDDWGADGREHREGVLLRGKECRGNTLMLSLQLSTRSKIQPTPGQYINIEIGKGQYRSYSVANHPQRDGYLELHIKQREGGVFSHQTCETLRPGDVLWIRGPYGNFSLLPESSRPLLFIATGTGFSPVKAMLESGLLTQNRKIRVYWGGSSKVDFYFMEIIESLAARFDDFKFCPVLSRPAPSDGWSGRVGYVQDWVESEIGELQDYEVYACGSSAMIQDSFEKFTTCCQLPTDRYYADAFYASGL